MTKVMEQKNSPSEKISKLEEVKKPAEKSKSNNRGLIVCCCLGAFLSFVFIITLIFIFYRIYVSERSSTNTPSTNNTVTTNSNPKSTTTSKSYTTYPVPNDCNIISPGSPDPLTITANGSGLNTNVNNIFYQIYGFTQTDLREQMVECGPKSEGLNYDGVTYYYYNWVYNYAGPNNNCNIEDLAVGVNVNIYLPKWNTPEEYQNGLQEKWNDFSAALSTHENDHRDIAYEGGQAIVNALSNLPNASSCDEISTAANNRADEIIDQFSTKQENFDSETNHGATQGAQFP